MQFYIEKIVGKFDGNSRENLLMMNNTKLKRTVFKRFESHSEKYHKLKFNKEKLKLN